VARFATGVVSSAAIVRTVTDPRTAGEATPEEEEGETRAPHARAYTESSARSTVLVVEDEPALRVVVMLILRREGFHVLVAEHGHEALAVAQAFEGRIDLVITDVIMPRLSAREMVTRLKELRPGVRVLYMSGVSDAEILRRRGLLEDPPMLLEKPFTAAELVNAAHAALRSPH
jgi:DNA-binding response OmpR family regulator